MTYCWCCGKKIVAEARKGDLYKLGNCCKGTENLELGASRSNLEEQIKDPGVALTTLGVINSRRELI